LDTIETHTIHLVCSQDRSFQDTQLAASSKQNDNEAKVIDKKLLSSQMSSDDLKKKYNEYYNYVYQTYYNHMVSQSRNVFHEQHSLPAFGNQDIPQLQPANLQPPIAINNQERQGFVQMAAAGGGAGDEFEEGFNRDWIYYIFKFVMFSIIVYYSSAVNAIMLLGIFGIIYVLQEGWLRFDRNRRDTPVLENPAPVAATTDGSLSEAINPENLVGINLEANIQQPSIFRRFILILKLIGTFIITFFMSLIPEQPAPLNLN